MSLKGPRCVKHPSHLLVGVCAFCLRERLAGLAEVECASDASHTHHGRRKKQSPGGPLTTQGSQKQPSERRGCDRPPSNISAEPIVGESSQNGPIPRISSSSHPDGGTEKDLEKSVVVETVIHATVNKSNKFSVAKTSPKPSISAAHDPFIARSPKSKELRGSDNISGPYPPIVSDTAHNEIVSMEMLPGRRSFSSVKRPSIISVESKKLPPVDIKMPILENDQHIVTETKSNMHLQKHTSVACTSPLTRRSEQAKPVPSFSQVQNGADRERNSFNAPLGVRRSLPLTEPTIENVKDEENVLSDASPNPKHKKKTLSSLFSLDDAEYPVSKGKAEESKSRSNVKGDALFNGSTNLPGQNILQSKTLQRRCRHGSFSERVEPSTYLFPVPETANSKPLSWFSALFRRRKKKSRSRMVETLASYSEHNNGWEAARQSWEAPRPSSWEQFRFSSFEGPRSSWEPARPSWEGVMRTSDGESVFSGIDFLAESLGEVREDALLAHKNQQESAAGDCMNGFSEAKRPIDGKRLGLKSKPLVPKTPFLEDKDRPHTFLSAKATLMQRDVSTQTTPPRASDATEIFIQQRLLRNRHQRGQHYTKAAVWSKVWTKTFSNSKWTFKQKHHKERQPKEMGIPVDEVHDQGNMTSGRSSFHEGTNIASNQHPKLTRIDNIEEHEAWDTFYSPLQESRDAITRVALKGDACIQKDEQLDKARGSSCALENGLLKFYLTPVRGHGKSKQGIYGL